MTRTTHLWWVMAAAGCAASPTPRAAPAPVDTRIVVTHDGWDLVGDFMRPAAATRTPAVLLLNRAAGDRTEYLALARALAARGIASLRLDLRAHGESTNRGRFVPFSDGATDILAGTDRDVTAALAWLRQRTSIDSTRLGVIGGSYSGELAVQALRAGGPVHAVALLSPGSLSEASVTWLDARERPWFFAASRVERTQATRDVITMVLAGARRADVVLVAAPGHASTLLASEPTLNEQLAVWFAARLRE